MGDSVMGFLTTGTMQSWLPLVLVVLSQLFTLLFIAIVSRVLQRKPWGLLGEQYAGSARGGCLVSPR